MGAYVRDIEDEDRHGGCLVTVDDTSFDPVVRSSSARHDWRLYYWKATLRHYWYCTRCRRVEEASL